MCRSNVWIGMQVWRPDLGVQLTLFQPGGWEVYAHHVTACPLGFENISEIHTDLDSAQISTELDII